MQENEQQIKNRLFSLSLIYTKYKQFLTFFNFFGNIFLVELYESVCVRKQTRTSYRLIINVELLAYIKNCLDAFVISEIIFTFFEPYFFIIWNKIKKKVKSLNV